MFAVGGIVGPVLFITAWVVAGAMERGYSPVNMAISRLAAVGASTRVLMTVGLVGFTIGILLFAVALRAAVPGPSWLAAIGIAVATVGVIAFPLNWTSAFDDVHGAFAVAAYASLAVTPVLAAQHLGGQGRRLGLAAGTISALSLAGVLLDVAPGLLQRAGLTVAHGWIVGCAAWMLARSRGSMDER